jgi:hypothetical protein
MTFKKCKVCGEEVIIWDLDKSGQCLDSCFASYDKFVGIKLTAPGATQEQKDRVIAAALDLCKAAGTARQAKEKLRHMVFNVSPDGTVKLEDDLPTTMPLRVIKDVPTAPTTPPANGHHVAKSLGNLVGRLHEQYGFTKPEDGSENRYDERRERVSPARHAFWWWVHNCIAHPLIGVVPRRFAFEFHDWTSRKLHGR